MDGVSLARYVVSKIPNLKTVVGLNQDYTYGRDEWADFKSALLKLKPDVQILDELFTPLYTTDYSAQISRILSLKPDLVHTSFWGPDLVNFITQAKGRGLFDVTKVAFARGSSALPTACRTASLWRGRTTTASPTPGSTRLTGTSSTSTGRGMERIRPTRPTTPP